MKLTATLEFNEDTLEEFWHSYNLFDHEEVVVGKLYLRENHLPPETIELFREVKDDE